MDWLILAMALRLIQPDTIKYEMYQYNYAQISEHLEDMKKMKINKEINNKLDSIIVELNKKKYDTRPKSTR